MSGRFEVACLVGHKSGFRIWVDELGLHFQCSICVAEGTEETPETANIVDAPMLTAMMSDVAAHRCGGDNGEEHSHLKRIK